MNGTGSKNTVLSKTLLILALFTISAPKGAVVGRALAETPNQRESRVDWWREARFGMFIHWGLYSIPGRGEWVQWNEQIPVPEYAKLAGQFKPAHFDPGSWAETAKAAGMKYMVMTSRHHDGFCMFDDPGNPFTSVASAAHRDFVAEYVRAVRKAGLRVGLYYSPLDWRFPGFFFPDLQLQSAESMRSQCHRQVRELATQYGPLDILWFDGGETDWLGFGGDWKGPEWRYRKAGEHYQGRFNWEYDKLYSVLRRLQPEVVINNRTGMPEDFHTREGEDRLGDFDDRHPWELCTTLAGAWGWQPNQKIKPLAKCVQLLAKVAGRDGNLLLNVGPRPDGRIDPPQARRLREIGEWLGKYGESIYGTRGGPFLPAGYGVSTRRGNKIYVHVLRWPGNKLVLPGIPARVVQVSVLTGGKAEFVQTNQKIVISMTPGSRNDMDTIVALELGRSADGLKPVSVTTAEIPVLKPSGEIYEAERAELSGGAAVASDHEGFLGKGFVAGYYQGTGQTTLFTVKTKRGGKHKAVLRYSSATGSPQALRLYVNGKFVRRLRFQNTADWDTWGDLAFDMVLRNGANGVSLQKGEGDGCVNLDYLALQ